MPTSRYARSCVFAIAFAVALGAIAFRFRYHALCAYSLRSPGLSQIQPVQVQAMPPQAVPPDWTAHDAGALAIQLPATFTLNADAPKAAAAHLVDNTHHRVVLIDRDFQGDLGLTALATQSSPDRRSYTLPALRSECYQADPRAFSWSMSPRAARWLQFLLLTRRLIASWEPQHAERITNDEIDGLLDVHKERAVFFWQSAQGRRMGTIHFTFGNDADLDWIRAACQSVVLKDKSVSGSS